MSDLDAALAGLAALDEEALGRPWTFRGGRMSVRYALYRTLEDAQEVCVRLGAAERPESRRILALAQRDFGDLRGLLLGLPADLLDRAPREGEWPLREVLRHVLLVERRYALQTRWAVERGDADPVRLPDDRMPAAASLDLSGDVGAILGRLSAARAETNGWLGAVPPSAMTRPAVWVHYEIDVRFRLHRFAAHLAEHTIQCEKVLADLGRRETEGRRIVRRLTAALGEIEVLGTAADLEALETIVVDRHASVRS